MSDDTTFFDESMMKVTNNFLVVAYMNDVNGAASYIVTHLGCTEEGFYEWGEIESWLSESADEYPGATFWPLFVYACSKSSANIELDKFMNVAMKVDWSRVARVCFIDDITAALEEQGINASLFGPTTTLKIKTTAPVDFKNDAPDGASALRRILATSSAVNILEQEVTPPGWIDRIGSEVKQIDLTAIPQRWHEAVQAAAVKRGLVVVKSRSGNNA